MNTSRLPAGHDTLSPMMTDVDTIKRRLEALLDLPGWSQLRLAEESGLSQGTISKFLNRPERGMQRRSQQKIAPILDRELGPETHPYERSGKNPVEGLQSDFAGFRKVPIIEIRRFPVGHHSEEELHRRICELAESWAVLPVSDPLAFGLRLVEAVEGKAGPGSRLIVGPKTPGVPEDWVAVETAEGVRVAQKTSFQGKPALRFPPNDLETEKGFRVIGKILGKWEPW